MTKQYLVKDWMTPDPITITPKTTVEQAHALIQKHRIRRLPVVDNGKLVGVVSWGDIREARPSDISSISIIEIYHALSNMPVTKIMSTDVVTIGPDESLGKAAKIMHDRRFACLPVMQGKKLIGIITAADIFRMVVEVTGYEE